MTEQPTRESVDDARQGETSGHMRWVLLFTIVGTIVAAGAVSLWMGA